MATYNVGSLINIVWIFRCLKHLCADGYCSCHYYRDYQSIPRLDTYDQEHLDEGAYDTIDPEARVTAEKTMRKRDRQVRVGHTTVTSCLCYLCRDKVDPSVSFM